MISCSTLLCAYQPALCGSTEQISADKELSTYVSYSETTHLVPVPALDNYYTAVQRRLISCKDLREIASNVNEYLEDAVLSL